MFNKIHHELVMLWYNVRIYLTVHLGLFGYIITEPIILLSILVFTIYFLIL